MRRINADKWNKKIHRRNADQLLSDTTWLQQLFGDFVTHWLTDWLMIGSAHLTHFTRKQSPACCNQPRTSSLRHTRASWGRVSIAGPWLPCARPWVGLQCTRTTAHRPFHYHISDAISSDFARTFCHLRQTTWYNSHFIYISLFVVKETTEWK